MNPFVERLAALVYAHKEAEQNIIPDVGKAPLQGGAYLSKGGQAHGSLPRLLLAKGVSARSLRSWQYMLFHYRARITANQNSLGGFITSGS